MVRCSRRFPAAAIRRRSSFAEGEDERVLRAVTVWTKGHRAAILIGRPRKSWRCIETAGLRIRPGIDYDFEPGHGAFFDAHFRNLLADLSPPHRAQGRVARLRARREIRRAGPRCSAP